MFLQWHLISQDIFSDKIVPKSALNPCRPGAGSYNPPPLAMAAADMTRAATLPATTPPAPNPAAPNTTGTATGATTTPTTMGSTLRSVHLDLGGEYLKEKKEFNVK